MPWKEICPMDEKLKFSVAGKSGEYPHAGLCRRFGVSRKTGYKWVARYAAEGVKGLEQRSRARHCQAHAVAPEVVEMLLQLKYRYPGWGPRKIRDWLILNRPRRRWPAASTIGELYQRHGLVKARKRRPRSVPMSAPLRDCAAANAVWSSDFKGQFRWRCRRFGEHFITRARSQS